MSNDNINATKRNINLDVLRIIMAFFVVCIHSVFPFKTEVTPIIDIAVPVFFMLSGWFFQPRNLEEQGSKLRNVLKSIVIIYFQATVLYLVWRLPMYMFTNLPFEASWRDLFTCENTFGAHLWYLHCYIYALLVLYLLTSLKLNLNKLSICLLISSVMLYAGMLSSYNIIEPGLGIRRVLFIAIGFLLMGKSIRYLKDKTWFSLFIIMILFIGSALFVIEYIYDLRQHIAKYAYLTSTYFLAIGLMSLFAKLPEIKNSLVWNYLAKIGYKNSLHIYIVHWIFIDLLSFLARFMGVTFIQDYCTPVIAFVLSLYTSQLYILVKGRLFQHS